MNFFTVCSLLVVLIASVQAQTCADNATNCANWKNNGFCEANSHYTDAQKLQYCGLTCGLCCNDASPTCKSWAANGFCSSKTYSDAVKKQYCANTCGLCGV